MSDASTPQPPPPPADRPRGPGDGYVPFSVTLLFAIGGAVFGLLALYSLIAFWPDQAAGGNATLRQTQHVTWFGWRVQVSRESLLFIVVALGGVLGGLVHAIRSIAWYAGNRDLRWSWVPFNVMLPVIGAFGGTIFYIVLRAGLFSPSTSVKDVSPFGFTAVSLLVGLFSEQALEKLRQVAANFFAEHPRGEDHVEPAKAPRAAAPPG